MAGRVEEAVTTFQAALIDAPNNGWALYGLMQAYEAQNDRAAAAEDREAVRRGLGGKRAAGPRATLGFPHLLAPGTPRASRGAFPLPATPTGVPERVPLRLPAKP